MTDYQRYIAEEIAVDHVDGLLSRREALRRLALLGVGTVAASALIAACAESSPGGGAPGGGAAPSGGPTVPSSTPAPPPGSQHALPTSTIEWTGPASKLSGAWAAAPQPKGALLVIHENKGLTDWVRGVAGRFAGIGYSALALDLLSPQGGTASFTDPAAATAALSRIPSAEFVANMRSGLDEVIRRTPGHRAGAVGFCMGGSLVWQLLAAGEPRLAVAAPFYGPLPPNPDFAGSKQAAVLAFYGALDKRVTDTEGAARDALDRAGAVHQQVIEPNADHAFFNDTGNRYQPTAAADAWQRLTAWLGEHLA